METTGEAGGEPKRIELSKTKESVKDRQVSEEQNPEVRTEESQEVIGDLRQSIFSGGWSQIREVWGVDEGVKGVESFRLGREEAGQTEEIMEADGRT